MNREHIKNVFEEYISAYDMSDDKIRLKAEHTYRVADNADKIARSIGLADDEIDLAWLIGMLHDIGRFEQLRRFGTFNDSVSINHAAFGVDLLFGEERLIERFADGCNISLSSEEQAVVELAIRNHNAYRIEEELNDYALTHCKIIRDADKIDIFRVQVEFSLETIYDTTAEALHNETITPEVKAAFLEHHAIQRSLMRTTVDHLVGHLALAFELEYDISLSMTANAGYLDKLMEFQSDNPVTREDFTVIKENLRDYITLRSRSLHA